MTVTRDPPRRPGPADPASGDDPLARVGRQLIAAEQRLRWRRARRRVVGGTAAGGLLVAACVAAVLPGGPLGGGSGDEGLRGDRSTPAVRDDGGRGTSAASGATLGVRGDVRLHFQVKWGGDADAVVLERIRKRLAAVGYPNADVRADGARIAVGFDWTSGRGSRAHQRTAIAAMLGQGQVAFYDWEASVVDGDGRSIAGRTDGWSRRTSMMAGHENAGMTLAVAAAVAERVPGPTVIVQALGRRADGLRPRHDDPRARFYVLRGSPPLTGGDVERVQAVPRGAGGPAVRYRVRPEVQSRLRALTRTASQRGQALMLPGVPQIATWQHLAIVFDDHVLSSVAIDPRTHPDGIDVRRGLDVTGNLSADQAKVHEAGLNSAGGPLPPLTPPVFERGG